MSTGRPRAGILVPILPLVSGSPVGLLLVRKEFDDPRASVMSSCEAMIALLLPRSWSESLQLAYREGNTEVQLSSSSP